MAQPLDSKSRSLRVRVPLQAPINTLEKSIISETGVRSVWCEELQQAYLIPVEDRINESKVVKPTLKLRIEPSKIYSPTSVYADKYKI